MTLASGARLGPYEVLSPLCAGGMGEVYRARDPRLKRDIALKVLPAHAAADPDRRARFEREAQSVAALNHPNIVTIYSVEEVDGVIFLTMELVEGQSLDDVIVKGGSRSPASFSSLHTMDATSCTSGATAARHSGCCSSEMPEGRHRDRLRVERLRILDVSVV